MLKAFLANRPVVANNRAEMAALGLRTVAGTEPSLSTAQMPLFAGDRFLGSIALDNHERENAYGEAELRLLSTVAASMGMALLNARNFDEMQRLLKETERRSSELAMVNDIQRALAAALDFNAIVEVVGDKLRELFDSDDIGITWLDDRSELIHTLYVSRTRQAAGHPAVPARLTEQDRRRAADRPAGAGKEPRRRRSLRHPHRARHEPQPSSVFVPVMVGKTLRAAIRLVSLDREDAFDDDTVNLLSTVAASMGVALDNARLFDETQEALQRQTATAGGAARARQLDGRCPAGVRQHLRQHVAAAAGCRSGHRLAWRRRPDPLARGLRRIARSDARAVPAAGAGEFAPADRQGNLPARRGARRGRAREPARQPRASSAATARCSALR